MRDIADDYAAMIVEEFRGPLDVIGVSTGGSVVQHFAADHPNLVRHLVIHSAAHTLSDFSKQLQLEVARLAQRGEGRKAAALLAGAMMPRSGVMKYLSMPVVWLASRMLSPGRSLDPNDLVVTVEQDPFYTPELFRETAAGIPNARLILYERMGHPASGKQFARDVLAFLKE